MSSDEYHIAYYGDGGDEYTFGFRHPGALGDCTEPGCGLELVFAAEE